MILLQAWKPDIPELEWYYAGGNTWIGRLRGQEIQGSSGGIPAK
jgi:hypothetical protein